MFIVVLLYTGVNDVLTLSGESNGNYSLKKANGDSKYTTYI